MNRNLRKETDDGLPCSKWCMHQPLISPWVSLLCLGASAAPIEHIDSSHTGLVYPCGNMGGAAVPRRLASPSRSTRLLRN
jgi:hypothetical protein